MVVTRFAPSPTGYLHIGGARTALFNWLFARKTKGKFILRIEDTDPKRNTPTATQQVIKDLKWLGIDWDEGPETGGANGPYFQSQRREIYDKYVQRLLEQKKAYYCFETAEELGELRRKAEAGGTGFAYRRPVDFPTDDDAARARAEGRPVTVRFAMPDTDIVVTDVVRGEVRFGAGEIGDFIILKSDGLPTYNFACVVDDALMGVTHVIRGQEHLMNTPAQQAVQQALGFTPPTYAHMSVTVSESGGKLSKRERGESLRRAIRSRQDVDFESLARAGGISKQELSGFLEGQSSPDAPALEAMAEHLGVTLPEINVVDFFKSGYVPEALVNFIALLGWNPGDNREVMRLEELIEAFDIGRLTKSNSLFNRKKLAAFNTEHIRMLDEQTLCRHFRAYVEAVGSPVKAASDELLVRLLKASEGARTLAEVEAKSRFLFLDDGQIEYDEKAVKKVLLKNDGQGLSMLEVLRARLAEMDELTAPAVENMLRSLAETRQVGLGKVAQPLRVAITGRTISPPIFDSVALLGREATLARIDRTLGRLRKSAESDAE